MSAIPWRRESIYLRSEEALEALRAPLPGKRIPGAVMTWEAGAEEEPEGFHVSYFQRVTIEFAEGETNGAELVPSFGAPLNVESVRLVGFGVGPTDLHQLAGKFAKAGVVRLTFHAASEADSAASDKNEGGAL